MNRVSTKPGAVQEVTPERRCTPHDPDDYFYSQAVEQHVVADMGGIIYGPYTGTQFASTSETDIEHIIARSETHDSGLCRAGTARRRRYMDDRDGDGGACEREAAENSPSPTGPIFPDGRT